MAKVILTLTMDSYDKMKAYKLQNNFGDLSDSDFLISVLNEYEKNIVTVKKEKEDNSYNNEHIEKPKNMDNKSFEQDILSLFDGNHTFVGQYPCSCGQNFNELSAFVNHNTSCNKINKTSLSIESRGLKRPMSTSKDLEPPSKRPHLVSEEYINNLPLPYNNNHTIHTELIKNMVNPIQSTSTNTLDQVNSLINSFNNNSIISNLTNTYIPDNKSAAPMNFRCSCSALFHEYKDFLNHTNICIKNKIMRSPVNVSRSKPKRYISNEDGKYSCEVCSKLFNTVLSLRQHTDGKHSDTPNHICELCGKAYAWLSSFLYHKTKCGTD